MLHHERLRPPPDDYTPDEWSLIEKAFHPEFIAHTEAILALGNGYLGIRGCPEEGDPSVQNGTFINGFYEAWPIVYSEEAYGFARTGQTILNITDSKIIRLFVDDEPFELSRTNLRHYDRRLNMKSGTLNREVLWETPSGKLVRITSRRLISFQQRHVAAISYEVTLLNAEAPVVISSEMLCPQPGVQKGEHDPRQARIFSGEVLHHRAGYARDRRIVLAHGTERTQMILACGIDHNLNCDCPHFYKTSHTENFGQVAFSIAAQPQSPIRLTKYMVYHSARTAIPESICGRAEWTLDRVSGQEFTTLLAEQEQYLSNFWRRSDVWVSDVSAERTKLTTVEVQQAIRVNLFHILQASARAEGTGVPAKGLTGQAYEGQYFWDTEIYLLPFFIYTSPHIAKNLLRFRYGMLDQARARARELNHQGALFPWRTISGEEASAYYAAGTAQYHINADIMYALRKYVNATGDEEFLCECGAEMLIETARLWYDLGFFSDRKGGKFCINGVTGPDEYNTVVDNNTYTNLMARENLRYAIDTIEALKDRNPEVLRALIRKTRLEPQEVADWARAATNMYVPFDAATGIYPQDDSFLDREPWDFKNTPADRYPLLLSYHPLNIYRYQVIKQADVILAMFLLSHEFSLEAKRRNFKFYDPLTTGDSSLSSCIEAIVALEVGEFDKALSYARAALLMDLADVGGNVKDGCHIASMGGTWMVFTYGFGGLRDYDGVLSFRPQRPPEAPSSLRFPLTYRGRVLDVEIRPDSTTYTLREGEELVIRHEDQVVTLTRANPAVTRPTLSPSSHRS
ncbi:MAG: family 65 glycosyl hydrolase [Proteobacteria bacterium]|nr:MAG: family 65 glycosyl hydrolase [Pseudomonadota bacterium]